MYAPRWRLWLVSLLLLAWIGLGLRFYLVKGDPALALMCAAMAAMNGFLAWQLSRAPQSPED